MPGGEAMPSDDNASSGAPSRGREAAAGQRSLRATLEAELKAEAMTTSKQCEKCKSWIITLTLLQEMP